MIDATGPVPRPHGPCGAGLRCGRVPAVDVAIVSYRRPDLLGRCLAALDAAPARGGMAVHVVENSDDPAVAELVRGHDAQLTLLGRNLGFGRAANVAIRAGSAPVVLVLNPDVEVRPGTLERVLAALEEHPEAGACGCLLERPDGTPDHASRRGFPTPLSALGWFTRIAPSGYALAGYDHAGPVDAINGAFMALRRAALDDVGLFDEGYWMYMEDLDLCRRLADAGWSCWFEPSASALHLKGGTAGRRSPALTWHFHRGMGRYYRRHEAPRRPAAINVAVYAAIVAKGAVAATLAARPAARRHTA